MIILDTNVLSELMKSDAKSCVVNWVSTQPPASLFITTVTQAEILYGIGLVPQGKRREALEKAVAGMFEEDFARRILAFDVPSAYAYATLAVRRRQIGKPITQFDAQIAAIALSRGAVVATRNVSDFDDCGIGVVDPWET